MKGRKPKPAKLKLIHGNPGKRRLPKAKAVVSQIPEPPCELSPEVAAIWGSLAPKLAAAGMLHETQDFAFLILCRAAADYFACCAAAPPGEDVNLPAKKAKSKKTESAGPSWSLLASARDKAETRLLKIMVEFGLTPSSAGRVLGEVGRAKAVDPMAAFIKGKSG